MSSIRRGEKVFRMGMIGDFGLGVECEEVRTGGSYGCGMEFRSLLREEGGRFILARCDWCVRGMVSVVG
jgi:hypothetical protein